MSPSHLSAGHRLRILDGGTGSELRRRGIDLSPACWSAEANLDHADVLRQIHADYIRAGADVITANTFATSRFVLAGAGLEAEFDSINRNAIATAREAARSAGTDVTIAASMSCLPPAFDPRRYPDANAEYSAYVELAECFAGNGADLILLEMMQSPAHAERACRAASASGLPFWAGVSCRVDPQSRQLVAFDDTAQPITNVIDAIAAFDPAGIAIMHSPVAATGPALEKLAALWRGATGAWAEIPYAQDPGSGAVESVGPEDYTAHAGEWIAAGVSLVGGCCGTTPAHIQALARLRGS
jgi:S-methylmethionine-dependent homocysteine/selenocysteine methylase